MDDNTEIPALLYLIEDPCEVVHDTVCKRILTYGKTIIPNLEELWEHTYETKLQEKIENIIHSIYFQGLQQDVTSYAASEHDLLQGALLVARYQYPEFTESIVLDEIEKVKRSIWLESTSYMTSFEQINIINRVFFQFHKYKGVEVSYQHPEEFLINKVVETKRGNTIINALIYQIVCNSMDVSVRMVNVPNQNLLAFFDETYSYFKKSTITNNEYNILFYIDPLNGHIYSHNDICNYLKKIGTPLNPLFFTSLPNKSIIQTLMKETAKCFADVRTQYKKEELQTLAGILSTATASAE